MEASSLRRELGERVISLRTMQPMLRACVVVAIGLLVAGLVLGLLRDAHFPDTKLSIAGANPIVIAVPALVLILVCFGLAWCYAICAVLYGPLLLRLGVLAVFAYAMLDQGSAFWTALWSGRGLALVAGLVVLAVAILAHGWYARRQREALASSRERLLTAAVFVLVAAVEIIAWWASRGAPLPGVFAISFIFQLSVFAVLANLYLSSSGADFAQVGGVIAGAVSGKIGSRRTLSTVAATALALALLVRAAIRLSWSLPGQIVLATAAGAVIGAIALRHRDALRRGRLPSWSAIATGLVVQAALTGAVLFVALGASAKPHVVWRLPPPTDVYRHASTPTFSIALPPGWKATTSPDAFFFLGTPTGVPAFAEAWNTQLRQPLSRPLTPSGRRAIAYAFDLNHFGPTAVLTPTADPGQLDVALSPAGRAPLRGRVTASVRSTRLWVVQVLAPAWLWPDFSPVAAAIVGSWRPDLSAQPIAVTTSPGGQGAEGQFGVIALGVALLIALMLVGFRVPPWFVFTGLLVMGSMLFAGLTELPKLVALGAGSGVRGVPHLSFGGVEAAIAIAVIVLALAPRWGRLSRLERWHAAVSPLAVLALVLLLLDLLLNVYAGAASAGTLLSVAGVTFLLAGFCWDVALSGDLTNSDGHRMRRPARVLMYMAYMLAASAAVLYFGSAHELGPWAVRDYFLEPDTETALSLGLVGVSYAVVVCIGRLASLPRSEEPRAATGASAVAPLTAAPDPKAARDRPPGEPSPVASQ